MQGWFKDKTENQFDYRSFSALYLLLRILFALVGVTIILKMKCEFGNDQFRNGNREI
jgi:hypothetical protein